MTEKILFIDNDNVFLEKLKTQFLEQYAVYIATCGADALKIITKEGPFAVVTSCMKLRDTTGIKLFQAIKKISPDSVRLMLTNNTEPKTAIDAINIGHVQNFLRKNCPPEILGKVIISAIETNSPNNSEKNSSKDSEKNLLESTLSGSIKLLMDMMSMVSPDVFGQTMAIVDTAKVLAKEMHIEDTWNLEMAAMLCHLGSVTLPPDTLSKIGSKELANASDSEKEMIRRLPEVSKNLISNIPRLNEVAEIVHYHQKYFNGEGFPTDDKAGENLPIESRILKVLCDLQLMTATGMDLDDVIGELTPLQNIQYDPDVFKMAAVSLCSADYAQDSAAPINVTLKTLRDGQILASNIETVDGRLLFATGFKLTSSIIERVLNYHRINKIKEPIIVFSNE